jgi:hypothetical protein
MEDEIHSYRREVIRAMSPMAQAVAELLEREGYIRIVGDLPSEASPVRGH